MSVCERFVGVEVDFFGVKKMLRFSGIPGAGAWMMPVYRANDIPCERFVERARPFVSK
jgi:hypothetical protein